MHLTENGVLRGWCKHNKRWLILLSNDTAQGDNVGSPNKLFTILNENHVFICASAKICLLPFVLVTADWKGSGAVGMPRSVMLIIMKHQFVALSHHSTTLSLGWNWIHSFKSLVKLKCWGKGQFLKPYYQKLALSQYLPAKTQSGTYFIKELSRNIAVPTSRLSLHLKKLWITLMKSDKLSLLYSVPHLPDQQFCQEKEMEQAGHYLFLEKPG